MNLLLGILAGAAIGTLGGTLKYLLLWRPVIKGDPQHLQKKVVNAQIGGMLLNVVVLIGAYFLSELLPWSQVGLLITAAVSLSVTGRLTTFSKLQRMAQTPVEASPNAAGRATESPQEEPAD